MFFIYKADREINAGSFTYLKKKRKKKRPPKNNKSPTALTCITPKLHPKKVPVKYCFSCSCWCSTFYPFLSSLNRSHRLSSFPCFLLTFLPSSCLLHFVLWQRLRYVLQVAECFLLVLVFSSTVNYNYVPPTAVAGSGPAVDGGADADGRGSGGTFHMCSYGNTAVSRCCADCARVANLWCWNFDWNRIEDEALFFFFFF